MLGTVVQVFSIIKNLLAENVNLKLDLSDNISFKINTE